METLEHVTQNASSSKTQNLLLAALLAALGLGGSFSWTKASQVQEAMQSSILEATRDVKNDLRAHLDSKTEVIETSLKALEKVQDERHQEVERRLAELERERRRKR